MYRPANAGTNVGTNGNYGINGNGNYGINGNRYITDSAGRRVVLVGSGLYNASSTDGRTILSGNRNGQGGKLPPRKPGRGKVPPRLPGSGVVAAPPLGGRAVIPVVSANGYLDYPRNGQMIPGTRVIVPGPGGSGRVSYTGRDRTIVATRPIGNGEFLAYNKHGEAIGLIRPVKPPGAVHGRRISSPYYPSGNVYTNGHANNRNDQGGSVPAAYFVNTNGNGRGASVPSFHTGSNVPGAGASSVYNPAYGPSVYSAVRNGGAAGYVNRPAEANGQQGRVSSDAVYRRTYVGVPLNGDSGNGNGLRRDDLPSRSAPKRTDSADYGPDLRGSDVSGQAQWQGASTDQQRRGRRVYAAGLGASHRGPYYRKTRPKPKQSGSPTSGETYGAREPYGAVAASRQAVGATGFKVGFPANEQAAPVSPGSHLQPSQLQGRAAQAARARYLTSIQGLSGTGRPPESDLKGHGNAYASDDMNEAEERGGAEGRTGQLFQPTSVPGSKPGRSKLSARTRARSSTSSPRAASSEDAQTRRPSAYLSTRTYTRYASARRTGYVQRPIYASSGYTGYTPRPNYRSSLHTKYTPRPVDASSRYTGYTPNPSQTSTMFTGYVRRSQQRSNAHIRDFTWTKRVPRKGRRRGRSGSSSKSPRQRSTRKRGGGRRGRRRKRKLQLLSAQR